MRPVRVCELGGGGGFLFHEGEVIALLGDADG